MLQAGRRIREYELEAKIGEGGMGEVWRARHITLERRVALKVLVDGATGAEGARARFEKEARAMGRLQHPRIVNATDFFVDGFDLFLVMPLFTGGSLADLLRARSGPLPVSEALRLSRDVLAALDHAHRQGVIHRDVKPSNILLDQQGDAHLTDFGIALMVGDARRTRTSQSIGTPHYMSPEQIRRPREVDHRTDVYSFGCVLYEMLTGNPPFDVDPDEEETDFAVRMAHVTAPPKPLQERNPAIPEDLEAVVLKALAKSPDDRFGGCGDLLRALEPAAPASGFRAVWTWPDGEMSHTLNDWLRSAARHRALADQALRQGHLLHWLEAQDDPAGLARVRAARVLDDLLPQPTEEPAPHRQSGAGKKKLVVRVDSPRPARWAALLAAGIAGGLCLLIWLGSQRPAPADEEFVFAEPMATEPMGTEPMGTEPMGTEPMVTEPLGTEPMGTEPMPADMAIEPAWEPEPPPASPPATPSVIRPAEIRTTATGRVGGSIEPGMRVVRGPDWKWGSQNGGGAGTVTQGIHAQQWVEVKWDHGASNGYRWGQGLYDLRIISPVELSQVRPGIRLRVRPDAKAQQISSFWSPRMDPFQGSTFTVAATDKSTRPVMLVDANGSYVGWFELDAVEYPLGAAPRTSVP